MGGAATYCSGCISAYHMRGGLEKGREGRTEIEEEVRGRREKKKQAKAPLTLTLLPQTLLEFQPRRSFMCEYKQHDFCHPHFHTVVPVFSLNCLSLLYTKHRRTAAHVGKRW